jgi:hypothetical protein
MASRILRELQIGEIVTGAEIVRVFDHVARPFAFAVVPGLRDDVFLPQSRVLHGQFLEVGDVVRFEARRDDQGRWYGDQVEVTSSRADQWGAGA